MTNFRPDHFWLDLCRAFLHDPPDKALDIPGHERRAKVYQAAILGRPVEDARDGEGSYSGDVLASAVERLPLPNWEKTKDQTTIHKSRLQRVHPVTGATINLTNQALSKDEDATVTVLQGLARAWPESRLRYLALWRLLPDLIGDQKHLPADTRLRDHSIIDHLDICAAYASALWREKGKGSRHHETALLSLSIGPVQCQITAARSTRDLWCGSWLISWLTFNGLLVLIERLGPQSVIFPSLRGNPLMDAWLMKQGLGAANREEQHRVAVNGSETLTAGLPNTGLALVPAHEADDLAEAIRKRIQSEWLAMGSAVREKLNDIVGEKDWASGWEEQMKQVWDVRVAVIPSAPHEAKGYDIEARKRYTDLMGDPGSSVQAADRLVNVLIKKGHLPSYGASPGLWMIESELAAKALGMQKQIRSIPKLEHDTRPKCSLYGSWAAMGPRTDQAGGMGVFQNFWKKLAEEDFGAHKMAGWIRGGERLSAVALTKRFAWSCAIQPELERWIGEKIHDRIPDTRQIATAWWQAQVEQGTESQWKKWRTAVEKVGDHFTDNDLSALLFACNTSESKMEISSPVLREIIKKDAAWLNDQRRFLINAVKDLKRPLLGPPRGYYAVLVADGDNMGAWLRGQRGMSLKEAYHPDLQVYFGDDSFVAHGGAPELARRPLTPASQAAFSACLTGFAGDVRKLFSTADKGHLVYAGGDDVLALVPIENALQTADAIRSIWEAALPGATLSMGIAMVHHQQDLRVAIQGARDAETYAKTHGRDALAFSVVRRHGDTTTALLPWRGKGTDGLNSAEYLAEWSLKIAKGLWTNSDRWLHRLIEEQSTLCYLANDQATRPLIGQRLKAVMSHGNNPKEFIEEIFELWGSLGTALRTPLPTTSKLAKSKYRFSTSTGDYDYQRELPNFLALMENLSFLARDLET